jgi:hypothetical protein
VYLIVSVADESGPVMALQAEAAELLLTLSDAPVRPESVTVGIVA